MTRNISLDSGPNNTGSQKSLGQIRVQLPLGKCEDYPCTEAIIMGLLEAGFALIPHAGMIHAKHRADGSFA